MAMTDVTVLGAGIFGLSVAWACVQRGARVRVIDPKGLGAGASGGIVGALAPHVPENWNDKKQFQFESLAMAQDYWREIENIGGATSGYGRTGRLQPILDTHGLELAQMRARTAISLWQGKAIWEVIAQGASDWEPRSPSGHLIHDTLSARIHPRQACHALAAALASKGTYIETDAPKEGLIVDATGWQGLLELSEHMQQPVGNGVKGQAALLQFAAPHDAPQLFADSLHIIPHVDGTVAIGSTSEREFEDPAHTDNQLTDVIGRARAAFPILADAPVVEKWAGVRPRAKSRAPILGRHPTKKGVFIANGGFKIGFGMAPKVGEVMADLVLEGRDTVPDGFRPSACLRS